ncbi:MAG: hypothetical protein ACI9VR_004564 [Cognaticolwellia sp.]
MVLSLLPTGRIDAWALDSGDHLWTAQGAGPMLAVQGDRVLDGQGVARAIRTGAQLFESGLSGLPVALGGQLAVLGWHRMWREGEEQRPVQALDPSPDAACFFFKSSLLIIDPGAKFVQYLDPQNGGLDQAAKGVPITSGTRIGEWIYLVREREVHRWDSALTHSEILPQCHRQQTLSVAEDCTVGISKGILGCWDGRQEALHELPGQPPTRPTLLRMGDRIVCETWQGLAICGPDAPPRCIDLPLGRRKARPLGARAALCSAGPEHVLLAAYPPQVVNLNTGRRSLALAPPPADD